jgi:hypothetical protein
VTVSEGKGDKESKQERATKVYPIYLLDPVFRLLETIVVCKIIYNKKPICHTIIRGSNCSKSLCAVCVPYLNFGN